MTVWTDAPLLPPRLGSNSLSAVTPIASMIPVFIDDEFKKKEKSHDRNREEEHEEDDDDDGNFQESKSKISKHQIHGGAKS